ncbi:MAG: prepilin-type N-terminal cleavage/methylation domain-containing protein [Thermoanaerobaculum sp.]|nr:prepilin-type N-terminal cleavage/methylation domain-containing protein [Thermoanaerobaculum sp.]
MLGQRSTQTHRQKGMTLIEVLVALAILLFVALAIVELFTMSYLANMGSLARTDLQYRAERLAESIRYMYAIHRQRNVDQPIPACGINFSAITPGEVAIPNDPNHPCWGYPLFRVVDADLVNARYELRYEITDEGQLWLVTVRAYPRETGIRYLGMAIAAKGVRYVAQLPK